MDDHDYMLGAQRVEGPSGTLSSVWGWGGGEGSRTSVGSLAHGSELRAHTSVVLDHVPSRLPHGPITHGWGHAQACVGRLEVCDSGWRGVAGAGGEGRWLGVAARTFS